MEEVGTEDDSDMQGFGPGRRYGEGGGARPRRNFAFREDGDESDESGQDSDGEGVRIPVLDPREEALADAAEARIARAHAKGRTDVKLNKDELAAYQRRLERRSSGQNKKPSRDRVAIPISHLSEPAPAQPNRLALEAPPQTSSPELPLSSSRSIHRSGSSSSRTPSRAPGDREMSPFDYTYLRKGETGAPSRIPSDHSSPGQPDAFQYMTGDSRASYHVREPPSDHRQMISSAYDDESMSDSSRERTAGSRSSRPDRDPERRVSGDKSPLAVKKSSSHTATSSSSARRKTTAPMTIFGAAAAKPVKKKSTK